MDREEWAEMQRAALLKHLASVEKRLNTANLKGNPKDYSGSEVEFLTQIRAALLGQLGIDTEGQ